MEPLRKFVPDLVRLALETQVQQVENADKSEQDLAAITIAEVPPVSSRLALYLAQCN